jgi:hypothetical protein
LYYIFINIIFKSSKSRLALYGFQEGMTQKMRLRLQPLPLGRVHGPVARLADCCNNSTTAFILIVMYLLLRRHSTAAALTNYLRFVLQRGSLEGVRERGSNGCVCAQQTQKHFF